MRTKAYGVMLIWTEFPAEDEREINEWYSREHSASRAFDLPGFHWGKRFVALSGEPKYLAVYATDSAATLASPEYLHLINNPDDKERRYVPRFYNTMRTICDVTASEGRWEGGILATLMLNPLDGRVAELREWVIGTLLPQLVEHHGILAAHLWETNADALETGSTTHTPVNVQVPDWIIALEATQAEDVAAARGALLSPNELRRRGASSAQRFGVYRMMVRVAR